MSVTGESDKWVFSWSNQHQRTDEECLLQLTPMATIGIVSLFSGMLVLLLIYIHERSGFNDPVAFKNGCLPILNIRCQPVDHFQVLFASAVGIGSCKLFTELLSPVKAWLGFWIDHQRSLTISILLHLALISLQLITFISRTAIIPAVLTLAYKASGGEGHRNIILGTFVVNVLLHILSIYFSNAEMRIPTVFTVLIKTVSILSLAGFSLLIQMPIALRVARLQVSTTKPSVTSKKKTIIMPLLKEKPVVLVTLVVCFFNQVIRTETCISHLLASCTSWIHIAACGILGILGAKRGISTSGFHWHWRAYLTPFISVFVVKVILASITTMAGKIPSKQQLDMAITDIATGGSCGVIFTYSYFLFAEHYAIPRGFWAN